MSAAPSQHLSFEGGPPATPSNQQAAAETPSGPPSTRPRGRPRKDATDTKALATGGATTPATRPMAEVLSFAKLAPLFTDIAAKTLDDGALVIVNSFRLGDADPKLAKELGFEGTLTQKLGQDMDALCAAYGIKLTEQDAAWIGLAMTLATCAGLYRKVAADFGGKAPSYATISAQLAERANGPTKAPEPEVPH